MPPDLSTPDPPPSPPVSAPAVAASPAPASAPAARKRNKILLKIDHDHTFRPKLFTWLKAIGWSVSFLLHAILLINLTMIPMKDRKEGDASVRGEFIDTALETIPERAEKLNEPLISIPEPKPEPEPEPETPKIVAPPPELALKPSETIAAPAPKTEAPEKKASDKGDKSPFGAAKFGEGRETIQGVNVRVGDPQFTLIWDTDADLDLHVEEPGGSHLYWADRRGAQGGELDVDDTDGFGPENIYWNRTLRNGQTTLGNGPPGVYHWKVKYYQGFGGESKRTRWKVRVKHDNEVQVFEGTLRRIGDESEVHTLTIAPPEKTATESP